MQKSSIAVAGIFLWVSGKLDSYEVELEKQSYELMEVDTEELWPLLVEWDREMQAKAEEFSLWINTLKQRKKTS
ncbi:hypothetical protein Y1Q_0019896 [Alligator mississippiensis]|uniref:Uncharacterized protein n=1 Tax=Alligator mississippiensis TaxID=8496 RepID=A0A151P8H4_ALLMI|nr:hypothetical protein Y1Q_0019896 [Alligator mississippiensis]